MQTTMLNIYFNGDDKNPLILIADEHNRLLSPYWVTVGDEPISIDSLRKNLQVQDLIESLDVEFQTNQIGEQFFIDIINDWIVSTITPCEYMRSIVHCGDDLTLVDTYNWTRYFRIKETAPGRFRPSVFRKPEYILQNKPAIVKPKDFFDRITPNKALAQQLMHDWEKFVAENQEVFVEILSQSFDDWMEIYGENTPVGSCMTGENGYYTSRFYELIPEAHPCLIRTGRSIVGRCIVWKIDDQYYQDRIYTSSPEYHELAISAFRNQNIDYIGNADQIAIYINPKQWERIDKLGWIPYMDNFDIAVVKGEGIFLVYGNWRSLFEKDSEFKFFRPTDTTGNEEIFRYVEEHIEEIYPA